FASTSVRGRPMRRTPLAIRRNIMDDKPVRQDGTIAELQDGKAPERASAEIKAIIEALIFASPEPLTPKAIFKLLDSEPKEDVQAALAELKRDYERPGGLQLVEVAGGFQIATRPDLHEWVRRLFHERTTQKRSEERRVGKEDGAKR